MKSISEIARDLKLEHGQILTEAELINRIKDINTFNSLFITEAVLNEFTNKTGYLPELQKTGSYKMIDLSGSFKFAKKTRRET